MSSERSSSFREPLVLEGARPELGRDHRLVPPAGERDAEVLLGAPLPVGPGRVEEGDPRVERRVDHLGRPRLVEPPPEVVATDPCQRDGEPRCAEPPMFHLRPPSGRPPAPGSLATGGRRVPPGGSSVPPAPGGAPPRPLAGVATPACPGGGLGAQERVWGERLGRARRPPARTGEPPARTGEEEREDPWSPTSSVPPLLFPICPHPPLTRVPWAEALAVHLGWRVSGCPACVIPSRCSGCETCVNAPRRASSSSPP